VIRAGVVALALLLGPAGQAQEPGPGESPPPPPPTRLRLHRLEARGLSTALVGAIEERLCQALSEAGRADVVCPSDVASAAELARQGMIFGACQTEACLADVERAAAASLEVRGQLVRDGERLRLTLTLRSPTGLESRAEALLPSALEPLLAGLPALARQLLAHRP
jgi:hypothetical protein